MQEKKALSHVEIREWAEFVEEKTTLSPQEAQVFVRQFHQSKPTIAEDLGIDRSQVDVVLQRIGRKIGEADTTETIGRIFSSRERTGTPSLPFGGALVGCSGPDCPEDVQTATTDPNFDDFYTKTINFHDHDSRVTNEQVLHFCSFECLQQHENFQGI